MGEEFEKKENEEMAGDNKIEILKSNESIDVNKTEEILNGDVAKKDIDTNGVGFKEINNSEMVFEDKNIEVQQEPLEVKPESLEVKQSVKPKKKRKKGLIIVIVIIVLFGLLLLVPSNKLILNGDEEITVSYMESFIDPGYELSDDSKYEVKVTNPVDTSKLGEYKVVYEVISDGEVIETHTRVVKVVDNVAPTITYSNVETELIYNLDIDDDNEDTYIELFDIKVEDNYDQGVLFNIDYSNFNKNEEGRYSIYVSSTDSNGNAVDKELIINYHKIHVESMTISKEKLTVYLNKTGNLTVEVLPKDAYDKSVNWSSSDISIAKVDSNGKITPVKEGTVRICAVANDSLTNMLTSQNVEVCSDVTVSATPKDRFINYIVDKKFYKKVKTDVYEWNFGRYGDTAFGTHEIDLKNHTYEEFSSGSLGISFLTTYDYKKNVITYTNKWGRYYMYIKWNLNTERYTWESNIYDADYAEQIVEEDMNDVYSEFHGFLNGAGVTREELIK